MKNDSIKKQLISICDLMDDLRRVMYGNFELTWQLVELSDYPEKVAQFEALDSVRNVVEESIKSKLTVIETALADLLTVFVDPED